MKGSEGAEKTIQTESTQVGGQHSAGVKVSRHFVCAGSFGSEQDVSTKSH